MNYKYLIISHLVVYSHCKFFSADIYIQFLPKTCESNQSNIPRSLFRRPSLHSITSPTCSKQLPSTSKDLSTNTKCVFSTPTQSCANITKRPEKCHNFTPVIIPPPPGFKPPVLNYSSHKLPQVKTQDTFSVLSVISVDSKTNQYSSVNTSKLEYDATLKDSSNYINHNIEHNTKETDKSKTIPLTNICTVSSANNKLFQLSGNTLSTASNTVMSSFNSCSPVTRANSYSSISQIKDTVALRNTDTCKIFDTKTNETQENLDKESKGSFSNRHNYVSKIVVENEPTYKNPFLSYCSTI